ncbi:dicarboxylate/amino acid:cation symporter [Candidatus Anaplasma sp. TIGMIC]|uniref:dicarboxylate/amino acid:cation symporter n=1 Tax=Candidatus Anaplasma sp. TIGMIC TaxID=3020713 RepID=UPI00232DE02E|nr:dicarboxylate/amino acid:cation symporter [Candidatus Anaplasma sp. TIGMIC]MDB1135714.1 dicarboxylate/amino acid:cation symporter [Candidatus Anaplasma sp. TIGMIC]
MFRFFLIFLAVGLAFLTKHFDVHVLKEIAQVTTTLFMNLLKLVGIPMIFLSVVSTFSSFSKPRDAKRLIGSTLFYTLLTTFVAAAVGLAIYLIISPSRGVELAGSGGVTDTESWSYSSHLISVFPDNFVKIFLDNNIMGCITASFLLGVGCLFIEQDKRKCLNTFFSALFDVLLHVAGLIAYLMPIAVWGFVTTFLYTPQSANFSHGLTKYILCVLLSNAVQAFIVLPTFMKLNGIPVLPTFKSAIPALITAFFSRSSVVALPVAVKCVNEKLGESKKITSFVLPLCASINMNACASFILITVLFVCEVNAHVFSAAELLTWIVLSVIAAVGNAGVPMGCYFVVMSYLVFMKVPLHVMGLILPIYTLIDMFETALNVWSDICVTRMVGKKCNGHDMAE